MSGRISVILLAIAGALAAQAQQRPSFEVATVKPNPNCTSTAGGPSPGRIELRCVTPRSLINAAYGIIAGGGIQTRPIPVTGGPTWLDSERFDVTAKAEGNPPIAQMMGPMLQALLEDRFQLKIHKEAKESPVYVLTVAKSGPKLTTAKEGGCEPIDIEKREAWANGVAAPCGMPRMTRKDGVMVAETSGASIDEFAGRLLGINVDRPVINKTGLTGRYDIRFEFTPERRGPVRLNGVEQPAPPPPDNAGPTVFAAVREQLGLQLTGDKAPVDVYVIDSAQRPTGN